MTLLCFFCFLPVGLVMDAECMLIPACDTTWDCVVTRYTRGARYQPPVSKSVVGQLVVLSNQPSPLHTTHTPVFKPPGDGRPLRISHFFSPSPDLPTLSQTHVCVPRGGLFLFRYIHISLLDTGSIADTCVTRGSIFLFSLHPNFAVRYCR